MHRYLIFDQDFRDLDIPLQPSQYRDLVKKVEKSIPIEPLPVWHGLLLKGHDAYLQLLKFHRHFTCKEMHFSRKSEAIAWICRQQLKRKDLVRPAVCWLLYRLYEALLDAENRKIAKERFQYKQLSPSNRCTQEKETPKENTAVLQLVGEEFHYDKQTIRRYVQFGRHLEHLNDMFPGIRIRVLKGEVEVAIMYMDALMEMPQEELKKMITDPQCRKLRPPEKTIKEIRLLRDSKRRRRSHVHTAIKETPAYDPDAELNGMTYTVGAWIKAITRTGKTADLIHATAGGKERLQQALNELSTEANNLYRILEGSK